MTLSFNLLFVRDGKRDIHNSQKVFGLIVLHMRIDVLKRAALFRYWLELRLENSKHRKYSGYKRFISYVLVIHIRSYLHILPQAIYYAIISTAIGNSYSISGSISKHIVLSQFL